jgi:hypothetical protein
VSGDVFNIPHFLSAEGPQKLLRAMLLNNIKNGTEYKYFDIQFDGKVWIAFYYKKAKNPRYKVDALNNVGQDADTDG